MATTERCPVAQIVYQYTAAITAHTMESIVVWNHTINFSPQSGHQTMSTCAFSKKSLFEQKRVYWSTGSVPCKSTPHMSQKRLTSDSLWIRQAKTNDLRRLRAPTERLPIVNFTTDRMWWQESKSPIRILKWKSGSKVNWVQTSLR